MTIIHQQKSLRKKCPYLELFWSSFFPHFPAFGLCQYSVRMWENTGKMGTRIIRNADTFYAVNNNDSKCSFLIIAQFIMVWTIITF